MTVRKDTQELNLTHFSKINVHASVGSCLFVAHETPPPSDGGRVLCRLVLTDLFQVSPINETLMVVTTHDQPFDGFLWHRCVVFGRFAKVRTQDIRHLNMQNLVTFKYDRILLMVRSDAKTQLQKINAMKPTTRPGVHLWADEKCNVDKSYVGHAKFSFRHYVCDKDTASHYIPNGFWRWAYGNSPELRGMEKQIRADSSCEGTADIVKASQRTHFFNWQGTIRRNRGKMADAVHQHYTTSTSADARYYFSTLKGSFDGPGKSFQDAVRESAFTLCPCGNNAETHRLWEALLAGSIPVQEDCSHDIQSSESERKFVAYLRQVFPDIIMIEDWDSLKFMLEMFENRPVELDEKQRSLYSSFMKFMVQIGMDSGDVVIGANTKFKR